ncbi:hypothetical protein LNAOJCKE_2944 [Methylorubrum aminovorans]|uniref:Uncharacterized protein n=1 Tax=Methylorubrum aminovorans TaxID=269069 RepID=A0ABQ4UFG0_9HYPH|nr:hypothetical protein [Methylorubrum aminovorans]GJE65733.1 hypothetical protein LNAOJCKE_2944 [Methylorubrum aminovorans]GMA77368.1 hypothetical protein GCM10025880_37850 [Methylorubrum aminovorans]
MSPTDATRPDDPVETPSARTYEQRPVAAPVPGHRSPAPTEPGDLAAERDEETSSPREESASAGGQGSRGG